MAAMSSAEDLPLAESHTSKLFLETSLPSSASPYPSPSSAFYPPPIPASHEFANKLASNRRYRGAAGNINLLTGGVGGLSSAGAQSSASATDPYLSAASATSSRRASDAFLAYSSSPSRTSADMKAATSAPGSRRTSRDASVNGRSSFQSAQPDESSGRPKDDITTQRDQPESSLPATSSQSDPAASLETPSSHEAEPSRIQPPEDLQSPNSVTSDTTTLTPSSSTMKRFSITSLTSTRPAPPSPVPSRRPSLQRKASSSRRSTHSTASRDAYPSTTPSDKVSGFPGDRSSRRQSTLSMSFTWLAAEGGTTEEKEEDLLSPRPDKQITKSVEGTSKPESVLSVNHDDGYISKPIIVRDFAYSEDDERFAKRPIELLPHSERPLTSGESHDQADGDGEWDEDDEDGGGWHTQWQLTPVQNGSNLEEVGDGTGGGWLDPDLPLPPGIYRAVYAFEAEGTAEMSLEEGQLVKVIGRGGGVGWAVVERDWTPERMTNRDDLDSSASGDGIDASGSGALALAGQALVPEGYLESYQVDDPGDVN